MSAYKWLDLTELSEQQIFERISVLEDMIEGAQQIARKAVRDGDRQKFQQLQASKRHWGTKIDELLGELDRRVSTPHEVAAGEHPPAMF